MRTNTVRLDSHAVATLRYIRASMEGAVSLAVPGSAGIILGIIGLITAALTSTPALHDHWLAIWLAGIAGSLLLLRA